MNDTTPSSDEAERHGSDIHAEILRKSPARYRWWLQKIEDAIAYMRITEDEVRALKAENERLKEENAGLLRLTWLIDEHPEDYNGPCECGLCESYANAEGESFRYD